jgi:hypothetical protein
MTLQKLPNYHRALFNAIGVTPNGGAGKSGRLKLEKQMTNF